MNFASCIAMSMVVVGCCKLTSGVHARTGQREYRAGQDVAIIVENGGRGPIGLVPGCGDQLERYENGEWAPVVHVSDPTGEPRCTDGATVVPCPLDCEEALTPVAACRSLTYQWHLFPTL